MKLVVKDPSEKRKRRQLFPTPAKNNNIIGILVVNPGMFDTNATQLFQNFY
jgi:hypothetical protein